MRTIETDATMYSLKNDRFEPSTVSIRMGNWCTVPNRTENAMLYDKRIKDVEEGHQMVTFHLSVDYFAKICADGTILDHGGFNYGFYDYYTGTWLHPSQESKNGKDVFTFDLEIDGVTYTIECTNTFRRDNLRPEAQEDGSSLIVAWLIENFEFNVPFEYDGLVFGILPCRDNRGMNKTEDGKFVANLSEEANFEEGIYFRLNGSVSPWMVG